jgi:hypothetical protein
MYVWIDRYRYRYRERFIMDLAHVIGEAAMSHDLSLQAGGPGRQVVKFQCKAEDPRIGSLDVHTQERGYPTQAESKPNLPFLHLSVLLRCSMCCWMTTITLARGGSLQDTPGN